MVSVVLVFVSLEWLLSCSSSIAGDDVSYNFNHFRVSRSVTPFHEEVCVGHAGTKNEDQSLVVVVV